MINNAERMVELLEKLADHIDQGVDEEEGAEEETVETALLRELPVGDDRARKALLAAEAELGTIAPSTARPRCSHSSHPSLYTPSLHVHRHGRPLGRARPRCSRRLPTMRWRRARPSRAARPVARRAVGDVADNAALRTRRTALGGLQGIR